MATIKKFCRKCGTPKVRDYCIPCHAASVRLWQSKNKDKIRAANNRWRKRNLAKKNELAKAYAKKYPDRVNAHNAKRRATRKSAVAPWAIHFFMREAYHLAKLRTKVTGFPWHVDHIVPLKSPIVCGLHVHNNLQVIPAKHNRAKTNAVWPDMP